MSGALVLVVGFLLLVAVLGFFVLSARRGREPVSPPPPETGPASAVEQDYFDPRTIKVGDTVYVQAARMRAIGALHLGRHGEEWTEYRLDDGTRRYQWLSVRERRSPEGEARHLEVMLWTEVPTQGMVPAKHSLIMEGVEFHPIDRGTAAFRSEGITGFPDRGLLDFADYQAGDGRLLSFQRFQGGQWSASYAHPLTPGSISVDRRP